MLLLLLVIVISTTCSAGNDMGDDVATKDRHHEIMSNETKLVQVAALTKITVVFEFGPSRTQPDDDVDEETSFSTLDVITQLQ